MRKLFRDYRIEILAGLFALLGVLFLSLRGVIAAFFARNGQEISAFGRIILQLLDGWVIQARQGLSISTVLAYLAVFLALVMIAWRIRVRFLTSVSWKATICPRCGNEIHRVHRNWFDHFLSLTLLPSARRYRCANEKCRWSGLRRRRPHETHSLTVDLEPLQEMFGDSEISTLSNAERGKV
jgi:hypothetical protein